jgi:PleD family two-component response regulator
MTASNEQLPADVLLASPKVLIVDDDELNVGLIAGALKDRFTILTATNGEDALRLMRDASPDLVLLDIMMPDVDGLEVSRRARADAVLANVPIIFVTAMDTIEGQSAGLELGAVDYITKPLNLEHLKLRVRNQLEIKRQRDQIMRMKGVLERRNVALERTLERVKRLEGLFTICMYCKKIRADGDGWQQLERYITEHSDARFSHGICPACEAAQTAELHNEGPASLGAPAGGPA